MSRALVPSPASTSRVPFGPPNAMTLLPAPAMSRIRSPSIETEAAVCARAARGNANAAVPAANACRNSRRPGYFQWLIADIILLPAAVALLERQDTHERFDGVDLAVVDLERLPHRQLIA